MKKKYIVLLVILALIGGGVYYLATNLESIVKKIVHKYGSEVTGTDVNIAGFSLSLKNGEGRISKITIANPKGYSTPYLLTLEDVIVKVDIKSLTTDNIIIEKILVNKPVVTYEMLSLVQNNVLEIQQNINNFSKKSAASKPAETKKETSSTSSKKVIIKNITINSGELNAITRIQDKENKISVTLPPITIEGIGQSNNGESIAAAISKVITKILSTASQTVVNSNLADLKNIAQENLDGAVNSVKDRLNVKGLFGK